MDDAGQDNSNPSGLLGLNFGRRSSEAWAGVGRVGERGNQRLRKRSRAEFRALCNRCEASSAPTPHPQPLQVGMVPAARATTYSHEPYNLAINLVFASKEALAPIMIQVPSCRAAYDRSCPPPDAADGSGAHRSCLGGKLRRLKGRRLHTPANQSWCSGFDKSSAGSSPPPPPGPPHRVRRCPREESERQHRQRYASGEQREPREEDPQARWREGGCDVGGRAAKRAAAAEGEEDGRREQPLDRVQGEDRSALAAVHPRRLADRKGHLRAGRSPHYLALCALHATVGATSSEDG